MEVTTVGSTIGNVSCDHDKPGHGEGGPFAWYLQRLQARNCNGYADAHAHLMLLPLLLRISKSLTAFNAFTAAA